MERTFQNRVTDFTSRNWSQFIPLLEWKDSISQRRVHSSSILSSLRLKSQELQSVFASLEKTCLFELNHAFKVICLNTNDTWMTTSTTALTMFAVRQRRKRILLSRPFRQRDWQKKFSDSDSCQQEREGGRLRQFRCFFNRHLQWQKS